MSSTIPDAWGQAWLHSLARREADGLRRRAYRRLLSSIPGSRLPEERYFVPRKDGR